MTEIWLGFFFLPSPNFYSLGNSEALIGSKTSVLELFHHQDIILCQVPRSNQTWELDFKDGKGGSLAESGQERSGDVLQQILKS